MPYDPSFYGIFWGHIFCWFGGEGGQNYSQYSKSVQNVVIHYIFSSESLRIVNSLQVVNSLRVLLLVCRGPLGFRGSAERKILPFLGGFPCFSKKRSGCVVFRRFLEGPLGGFRVQGAKRRLFFWEESETVSANRVAAMNPPPHHRRYGPDTEIQHRPREPHGLAKTSRFLSKREADMEFQYRHHIVDADAIFADAISETPIFRRATEGTLNTQTPERASKNSVWFPEGS